MKIGWWVEETPEQTDKAQKPKVLSRVYEVKAAAEQFAELARKTAERPEAIVVRTNCA